METVKAGDGELWDGWMVFWMASVLSVLYRSFLWRLV